MIITILSFFVLLLANTLNLIQWDLPANVYATLAIILEYMMRFDGLVPVQTMIAAFIAILVFEVTLFSVRVFIALFSFIRGSGSLTIE